MRKPFRDPQLSLVFPRKVNANPLPEGRGAFTDIYRHIKNFTCNTTHQLALGMGRQLIVQPTQHPFRRFGVIILHKGHRIPYRLLKQPVVKTLKEKTTLITKYFWLKDKHIWNCCLDYIHM